MSDDTDENGFPPFEDAVTSMRCVCGKGLTETCACGGSRTYVAVDALLSDATLDEVCAAEWGVSTTEDWPAFKRQAAEAVLRQAAAALTGTEPT